MESDNVGSRVDEVKTTDVLPSPQTESMEKGQMSPLTGAYLLIVISEPHSAEDQDKIIQRLNKGLLCWDMDASHVDLNCELLNLTNSPPEGDVAKNGEKLIQWASENLVVEVLYHSQVNTLIQCVKNLLSSFTRYRHIIHAGYSYQGTGSWILQDGTFSIVDFTELWDEPEVYRLLPAYKSDITVSLQCAVDNGWSETRFRKEPFSKLCQLSVNGTEKLSNVHNAGVGTFVDYLSSLIAPSPLKEILQPSEIVGNIRFSHPTLYVFPGGQGDAALFGVNGFNMLIDGGYSRKACFWDFTRHLDRLDAVLLTRVNNNDMGGIGALLERKNASQVFPQIGHFFGNIMEKKGGSSELAQKGQDDLILSLTDQGYEMYENLRGINMKPHFCARENMIEPINLYHKVGHGKLDMYILNPVKDSKELKEFLSKWKSDYGKHFSTARMTLRGDGQDKECPFPVLNLVSICALLVWQPANLHSPITRILFPGSTPQQKIFESLTKLKHLEFLRYPSCTGKTLAAAQKSTIKSEKIITEVKHQLKSKEGGSYSYTTIESKVYKTGSAGHSLPKETKTGQNKKQQLLGSSAGRSETNSTASVTTLGDSSGIVKGDEPIVKKEKPETPHRKSETTKTVSKVISTTTTSTLDNKVRESRLSKFLATSKTPTAPPAKVPTRTPIASLPPSAKKVESKEPIKVQEKEPIKSEQQTKQTSPSSPSKKDLNGTEKPVPKTGISKSISMAKAGSAGDKVIVASSPKQSKEDTNRKVIEHKTRAASVVSGTKVSGEDSKTVVKSETKIKTTAEPKPETKIKSTAESKPVVMSKAAPKPIVEKHKPPIATKPKIIEEKPPTKARPMTAKPPKSTGKAPPIKSVATKDTAVKRIIGGAIIGTAATVIAATAVVEKPEPLDKDKLEGVEEKGIEETNGSVKSPISEDGSPNSIIPSMDSTQPKDEINESSSKIMEMESKVSESDFKVIETDSEPMSLEPEEPIPEPEFDRPPTQDSSIDSKDQHYTVETPSSTGTVTTDNDTPKAQIYQAVEPGDEEDEEDEYLVVEKSLEDELMEQEVGKQYENGRGSAAIDDEPEEPQFSSLPIFEKAEEPEESEFVKSQFTDIKLPESKSTEMKVPEDRIDIEEIKEQCTDVDTVEETVISSEKKMDETSSQLSKLDKSGEMKEEVLSTIEVPTIPTTLEPQGKSKEDEDLEDSLEAEDKEIDSIPQELESLEYDNEKVEEKEQSDIYDIQVVPTSLAAPDPKSLPSQPGLSYEKEISKDKVPSEEISPKILHLYSEPAEIEENLPHQEANLTTAEPCKISGELETLQPIGDELETKVDPEEQPTKTISIEENVDSGFEKEDEAHQDSTPNQVRLTSENEEKLEPCGTIEDKLESPHSDTSINHEEAKDDIQVDDFGIEESEKHVLIEEPLPTTDTEELSSTTLPEPEVVRTGSAVSQMSHVSGLVHSSTTDDVGGDLDEAGFTSGDIDHNVDMLSLEKEIEEFPAEDEKIEEKSDDTSSNEKVPASVHLEKIKGDKKVEEYDQTDSEFIKALEEEIIKEIDVTETFSAKQISVTQTAAIPEPIVQENKNRLAVEEPVIRRKASLTYDDAVGIVPLGQDLETLEKHKKVEDTVTIETGIEIDIELEKIKKSEGHPEKEVAEKENEFIPLIPSEVGDRIPDGIEIVSKESIVAETQLPQEESIEKVKPSTPELSAKTEEIKVIDETQKPKLPDTTQISEEEIIEKETPAGVDVSEKPNKMKVSDKTDELTLVDTLLSEEIPIEEEQATSPDVSPKPDESEVPIEEPSKMAVTLLSESKPPIKDEAIMSEVEVKPNEIKHSDEEKISTMSDSQLSDKEPIESDKVASLEAEPKSKEEIVADEAETVVPSEVPTERDEVKSSEELESVVTSEVASMSEKEKLLEKLQNIISEIPAKSEGVEILEESEKIFTSEVATEPEEAKLPVDAKDVTTFEVAAKPEEAEELVASEVASKPEDEKVTEEIKDIIASEAPLKPDEAEVSEQVEKVVTLEVASKPTEAKLPEETSNVTPKVVPESEEDQLPKEAEKIISSTVDSKVEENLVEVVETVIPSEVSVKLEEAKIADEFEKIESEVASVLEDDRLSDDGESVIAPEDASIPEKAKISDENEELVTSEVPEKPEEARLTDKNVKIDPEVAATPEKAKLFDEGEKVVLSEVPEKSEGTKVVDESKKVVSEVASMHEKLEEVEQVITSVLVTKPEQVPQLDDKVDTSEVADLPKEEKLSDEVKKVVTSEVPEVPEEVTSLQQFEKVVSEVASMPEKAMLIEVEKVITLEVAPKPEEDDKASTSAAVTKPKEVRSSDEGEKDVPSKATSKSEQAETSDESEKLVTKEVTPKSDEAKIPDEGQKIVISEVLEKPEETSLPVEAVKVVASEVAAKPDEDEKVMPSEPTSKSEEEISGEVEKVISEVLEKLEETSLPDKALKVVASEVAEKSKEPDECEKVMPSEPTSKSDEEIPSEGEKIITPEVFTKPEKTSLPDEPAKIATLEVHEKSKEPILSDEAGIAVSSESTPKSEEVEVPAECETTVTSEVLAKPDETRLPDETTKSVTPEVPLKPTKPILSEEFEKVIPSEITSKSKEAEIHKDEKDKASEVLGEPEETSLPDESAKSDAPEIHEKPKESKLLGDKAVPSESTSKSDEVEIPYKGEQVAISDVAEESKEPILSDESEKVIPSETTLKLEKTEILDKDENIITSEVGVKPKEPKLSDEDEKVIISEFTSKPEEARSEKVLESTSTPDGTKLLDKGEKLVTSDELLKHKESKQSDEIEKIVLSETTSKPEAKLPDLSEKLVTSEVPSIPEEVIILPVKDEKVVTLEETTKTEETRLLDIDEQIIISEVAPESPESRIHDEAEKPKIPVTQMSKDEHVEEKEVIASAGFIKPDETTPPHVADILKIDSHSSEEVVEKVFNEIKNYEQSSTIDTEKVSKEVQLLEESDVAGIHPIESEIASQIKPEYDSSHIEIEKMAQDKLPPSDTFLPEKITSETEKVVTLEISPKIDTSSVTDVHEISDELEKSKETEMRLPKTESDEKKELTVSEPLTTTEKISSLQHPITIEHEDSEFQSTGLEGDGKSLIEKDKEEVCEESELLQHHKLSDEVKGEGIPTEVQDMKEKVEEEQQILKVDETEALTSKIMKDESILLPPVKEELIPSPPIPVPSAIRTPDIKSTPIRTPDEVAELPIHYEVESTVDQVPKDQVIHHPEEDESCEEDHGIENIGIPFSPALSPSGVLKDLSQIEKEVKAGQDSTNEKTPSEKTTKEGMSEELLGEPGSLEFQSVVTTTVETSSIEVESRDKIETEKIISLVGVESKPEDSFLPSQQEPITSLELKEVEKENKLTEEKVEKGDDLVDKVEQCFTKEIKSGSTETLPVSTETFKDENKEKEDTTSPLAPDDDAHTIVTKVEECKIKKTEDTVILTEKTKIETTEVKVPTPSSHELMLKHLDKDDTDDLLNVIHEEENETSSPLQVKTPTTSVVITPSTPPVTGIDKDEEQVFHIPDTTESPVVHPDQGVDDKGQKVIPEEVEDSHKSPTKHQEPKLEDEDSVIETSSTTITLSTSSSVIETKAVEVKTMKSDVMDLNLSQLPGTDEFETDKKISSDDSSVSSSAMTVVSQIIEKAEEEVRVQHHDEITEEKKTKFYVGDSDERHPSDKSDGDDEEEGIFEEANVELDDSEFTGSAVRTGLLTAVATVSATIMRQSPDVENIPFSSAHSSEASPVREISKTGGEGTETTAQELESTSEKHESPVKSDTGAVESLPQSPEGSFTSTVESHTELHDETIEVLEPKTSVSKDPKGDERVTEGHSSTRSSIGSEFEIQFPGDMTPSHSTKVETKTYELTKPSLEESDGNDEPVEQLVKKQELGSFHSTLASTAPSTQLISDDEPFEEEPMFEKMTITHETRSETAVPATFAEVKELLVSTITGIHSPSDSSPASHTITSVVREHRDSISSEIEEPIFEKMHLHREEKKDEPIFEKVHPHHKKADSISSSPSTTTDEVAKQAEEFRREMEGIEASFPIFEKMQVKSTKVIEVTLPPSKIKSGIDASCIKSENGVLELQTSTESDTPLKPTEVVSKEPEAEKTLESSDFKSTIISSFSTITETHKTVSGVCADKSIEHFSSTAQPSPLTATLPPSTVILEGPKTITEIIETAVDRTGKIYEPYFSSSTSTSSMERVETKESSTIEPQTITFTSSESLDKRIPQEEEKAKINTTFGGKIDETRDSIGPPQDEALRATLEKFTSEIVSQAENVIGEAQMNKYLDHGESKPTAMFSSSQTNQSEGEHVGFSTHSDQQQQLTGEHTKLDISNIESSKKLLECTGTERTRTISSSSVESHNSSLSQSSHSQEGVDNKGFDPIGGITVIQHTVIESYPIEQESLEQETPSRKTTMSTSRRFSSLDASEIFPHQPLLERHRRGSETIGVPYLPQHHEHEVQEQISDGSDITSPKARKILGLDEDKNKLSQQRHPSGTEPSLPEEKEPKSDHLSSSSYSDVHDYETFIVTKDGERQGQVHRDLGSTDESFHQAFEKAKQKMEFDISTQPHPFPPSHFGKEYTSEEFSDSGQHSMAYFHQLSESKLPSTSQSGSGQASGFFDPKTESGIIKSSIFPSKAFQEAILEGKEMGDIKSEWKMTSVTTVTSTKSSSLDGKDQPKETETTTTTRVVSSTSGDSKDGEELPKETTTTTTVRLISGGAVVGSTDGQSGLTKETTTTSSEPGSSSSSTAPSSTKQDDDNDILKKWGKPLGLPGIHPDDTSLEPGTNEGRLTPRKDGKSSGKTPSTPKSGSQTGKPTKRSTSHYKTKNLKPIYVDLAYVPHHGNSNYSDSEFFRLIRSRYYVFSGLEPSREVFDGLLRGKQEWEDKNLDVTIVPTYDTDTLGYWVVDSEVALAEGRIDLAPSASRCTINLQDHETSCSAYRLEF